MRTIFIILCAVAISVFSAKLTRDLNYFDWKNLKEYSMYFKGFSSQNNLKVDVRLDAKNRNRNCAEYILLSLLFLPIYVSAEPLRTETCVAINKNQVISFFDRWNNALKTKDPEKVAANYAENAVLLPTLANEPRIGHAQIKDYFVHFLKKNPVATINQRNIQYGCNWATDIGLYTFQTTVAGKKQNVKARYSYVYENIDGKWLIIEHHSSLMPVPSDR